MIKNSMPIKSWNPGSDKKLPPQLETSSANVHIVGEDLLRAFFKLFYLRLCVSSD